MHLIQRTVFIPACIDPTELMETGRMREGGGGGGTSNRIALIYRPIRPYYNSNITHNVYIIIKKIFKKSCILTR